MQEHHYTPTTKGNMDTTRRYPRTLNEAFPNDASYACAIERCEDRANSFFAVILACAVSVASFLFLAWVLS